MNCSREHFFTLSSDELSAIIVNTESIVKLCGEAPILVKEKTACQQHELVQWKAWQDRCSIPSWACHGIGASL